MGSNTVTAINIFWRQNLNFAIKIIKKVDFEKSWPFSLIVPKLCYKYLNFQILVIKVYFKKISAHNLSGGSDIQNFSHTQNILNGTMKIGLKQN